LQGWFPEKRYGSKDSAFDAAVKANDLYKKELYDGETVDLGTVEDEYTRLLILKMRRILSQQ